MTLGHLDQHPGLDPPAFIATIHSVQGTELILDQTSFYPVGGGQPSDRGHVICDDVKCDVIDIRGKDPVIHSIDSQSDYFHAGQNVRCIIDTEWRNQLCKMHTAQHIVSALAEDLWGAETVGNQLSVDNSRVDLLFEDKEVFNPDNLVEATNSVISSNVPVNIHQWERTRILEHEQMRHTKFMHRIPTSITQLRVVEIEGIDLCPCAGTHVSNTSMIPKIKFLGKKNKGKGRIRFSYIFE